MTIETMSAFNEQQFEKKLLGLKDSQESIQALSTWCLQHRQHHKKIVISWHKVLKKVKLDHRLTLFYLANDVIQYSKRRNYEFVESWGTALQRATTMVRDEKVKEKILRIFRIWGERGIYDETFVSDLCGLMCISTRKKPVESEPVDTTPDPMDFHSSDLFKKIRSCHKLEDDTDLRLKQLNESHKVFTDADALRSHLKDRRQGEDVVTEVDEGGKMMEAYMAALGAEIGERRQLIDELDLADRFYDVQQGDARLVVSAYKNFGNRVNNLKRHLDDRMATYACPSPIPSPDVNAPSPEPDCDIELPEDQLTDEFIPGLGDGNQGDDNCFASFLGKSFDFQENLFNDSFEEQNGSEGKPIEVINSRAETEMESSINNFLKTLGNLTSSIPAPSPVLQEQYLYTVPLPPPPPPPSLFSNLPSKFPTWEEGDSWEEGEEWLGEKEGGLETPDSPPMCEKESFAEPLEYDDSATLDVDHRSDIDHRLLRIPLPAADVDHRVARNKDVDHRNLISLTGSPSQEGGIPRPPLPPWPVDQDYRQVIKTVAVDGNDVDYRIPPPPPPPPPPAPIRPLEEMRDNVESVDMDLSDDECAEQSGAESLGKRERPCEDMNNIKPLLSMQHPSTPPPLRPPPIPMPLLMNRAPFRPHLPGPRSLLSMPLLPPPNMPAGNGTPPPLKKMRLMTEIEQEEEEEEVKFIDDVIDLELDNEAMGNGCADSNEESWHGDMNGRLRGPLLRTPSNEMARGGEHWQDDDVPSFNDWTNRGRSRGPGFPHGGFPPRPRMPLGRGGPHMGGGPMRRPYGGRPGPRPFRVPYMARPGSYGSW